MTILESLQSNTPYPVSPITIEKLCVMRGLVSSTVFSQAIGESEAYQLCEADLYLFLFTAPDLREQEITINLQDRQNYQLLANKIYNKFGDSKYVGKTYGNRGEDWNAK